MNTMRPLPIVIVSALVFALASCTQCQECVNGSSRETLCESEFDTPEQYRLAIDNLEAQGADCTAKGLF